MERSIRSMFRSPQQVAFGYSKRDTLPTVCRECPVRFACNGGCLKHRFVETTEAEPGLNYLCAGLKHFFTRLTELFSNLVIGWGKSCHNLPVLKNWKHTIPHE